MNWGSIITVFTLSTFKFLFAPFTGRGLDLPFWETFLTCVAGGCFSAAIFFFASEIVISFSENRRKQRIENCLKNGTPPPVYKKFTWSNRFIIRMKRSLGMYGICFWAPFFLSVPIGSVVVAKFYGKEKSAYPLIVAGMAINAMIMCSLAYWVF
jgi:hypothetical protein